MRLVPFLLALAVVSSSVDAFATSTTVPDNYSTIQAAINANVDTVWVKGGTYEETVNITHAVLLTYDERAYFPAAPIVRRITSPSLTGVVRVRGFHILGGAAVTAFNGCEFTFCRADSGISCTSQYVARVMGCVVYGTLSANGLNSQVMFNSVNSGGISAGGNGSSPISNNLVTGPAATGITLGSDCYAYDNHVRACTDGIRIAGTNNAGAYRNIVEDCTGRGIVGPTPGPGGQAVVDCMDNVVRRVGGVGVQFTGVGPTIMRNTVDSTGSTGMSLLVVTATIDSNTVRRANGPGIVMTTIVQHIRGNVVTHCAGDGIRADLCPLVDYNVSLHNAGAGIKLLSDDAFDRIRSNTCSGNSGPGISLQATDSDPDSVNNNISAANGVGLERIGAGVITLGCNDWYANPGGATTGVSAAATDFSLDPLFCNLPADIVTLASTSPALSRAGCGLVGALGLGCPTASTVPAGARSSDAGLRSFPQPSRGAIHFAWAPQASPVTLEIFDAQGALRFSRDVSAGTGEVEWSLPGGDRSRFPAGVYFARLRDELGERGACRVVVLR